MPKIIGFGDKLKRLRRRKGMNQSDVAEALGISLRAYSRYECHSIMPRDPNLIVRMADFFNVDKRYLMLVTPSSIELDDNEIFFQKPMEATTEEEQAQLLARDAIIQLENLYASGKLGQQVEDEIAMIFSTIYFRAKFKTKDPGDLSNLHIDEDDIDDDDDDDE